jgi:hypothetical protein
MQVLGHIHATITLLWLVVAWIDRRIRNVNTMHYQGLNFREAMEAIASMP